MIRENLAFLDALKENNHRDWFQSQKKAYELYKKNYHLLIEQILNHLAPLDESLQNLSVKNCTFRINRDIRFSKDKSPYKTHMSIWFPCLLNTKNTPGYYVHLDSKQSFIAGGIYCPEAHDLKKIRTEIAFFYEDLNLIIEEKSFKKEYNDLDRNPEQMLKTAPKDFEKNHVAIDLLRLKSYTATQNIDQKLLTDPQCSKIIAEKLSVLKPLNSFLLRALDTEE